MKDWLWIAGAALTTVPSLALRFSGMEVSAPAQAGLSGLAILGAAFLLSWATEVAEMDIPQALALSFLALIAVLPEYAVDLTLAWKAGHDPAEYAPLATANMTGANRLLIGVGWPLVVFLFWAKTKRQALHLEPGHRTEIFFLVLATLYSFAIPFKGSISLLDAGVLVSLFLLYLWAASRGEREEPELVGPARAIGALPVPARRSLTVFLLLFSALVILAAADPFVEGLKATGKGLNISEFILIQWVAPLASEAPEVTVAVLFVLRGHAGAGMGVLISSKVNQWTLLVGTLPIVYSISSGGPAGLPLDGRQMEEIFLTSAQSAFGLLLLVNLRFSLKEALALFLLFITQLFIPIPAVRYGYAGFYLLLAGLILLRDRSSLTGLRSLVGHARGLAGSGASPPPQP